MPINQIAKEAAISLVRKCITPSGLLASPLGIDNYRRIWARDAMIAGITGTLINEQEIGDSLAPTVETLLRHQAQNGQIPSNVSIDGPEAASFGSTAGRVDATTWWIIGACILIKNKPDPLLIAQLREPIKKALALLHAWEMNQRGLVYTPLGGNWADEYISQGYVLYDQCLRLWALRLAAEVFESEEYKKQSNTLAGLITSNYYAGQDGQKYHPLAYSKAAPKPYFWFQFGPQGYDTRWDMAANALVLLLDLHPEPAKVEAYLFELAEDNHSWLLPVFHPVILPSDPEWGLLSQNYSYRFKNQPHHFHNGGCWPVFMGLLALGLAKQELGAATEKLLLALETALSLEYPSYSFHEYWATDTQQPSGVASLCYTASGYLLLHYAHYYHCKNIASILP
jgi:hypothetical protein